MADLKKVILDRLANLDDEQLLDVYAAVRAATPSQPPPAPRPPSMPPPAEISGFNTRPGSTASVVWRVLTSADRMLPLRDVTAAAQRIDRKITRAMVSSALTRLHAAGKVVHEGEAKSWTYGAVRS